MLKSIIYVVNDSVTTVREMDNYKLYIKSQMCNEGGRKNYSSKLCTMMLASHGWAKTKKVFRPKTLARTYEVTKWSKIGCKQTQLDHVIRVTATSKAILPCNKVFVKISELGIHL